MSLKDDWWLLINIIVYDRDEGALFVVLSYQNKESVRE